jgi:hypothetical protein
MIEIPEWFEMVRKSRLVEDAILSTWLQRDTGADARTIAASMVSDGLLTQWQSEKLLDRKYKGFLVDHYCLRNNLGMNHVPGRLVFEALNLRDRKRVILEVLPPSRDRREDGGLIYRVVQIHLP